MKYMGSKRTMLQNGLGELLAREAVGMKRFVDLFAGSGAVGIHIGQRHAVPILAYDLQEYSVALANAVINRDSKLRGTVVWENWFKRAELWLGNKRAPESSVLTINVVREIRDWCAEQSEFPVTYAYGGHYFSAHQAMWIDAFRVTLPRNDPARTVALAALIQAASQCAASPGHTAQPFQPTRTSKPFLHEAWNRDIVDRIRAALLALSDQHVLHAGQAAVANANDAANTLREGDVAFIDPPYSGVHYSRFYHVLETIAHGKCGEVTGIGRYPASERRPRSKYSVQTESKDALDDLFSTVASQGAKAIVTFPDHKCSNGLSGDNVRNLALKYFKVKVEKVKSKFSTLGGIGIDRKNKNHRAARQLTKELILVMEPR